MGSTIILFAILLSAKIVYSKNPCENQADGKIFPYKENTINYLICLEGEPILMNCEDGQIFDTEKNICNVKERLDSNLTNTDKESEELKPEQFKYCDQLPDGTQLGYSKDCNEFYFCVNNIALLKRCPENLYFNSRTQYCLPEDDAQCDDIHLNNDICKNKPQGTMLPYPDDCGKFLICVFDKPVEKHCPSGLHFSPTDLVCTYPEDAGCETLNLCKGQPNGELFPNIRNCSSYYLCFFDKAELKICPNDLHFSAEAKHCMLPELAGCDPSYTTTTSTGTTLSTTVTDDPTTEGSSSEPTVSTSTENPTPPDTTTEKPTPPDTTTEEPIPPKTTTTESPIKPGSCKNQPLGKHIKHPSDCTKYIVCIGGGVEMNCPPPLEFSETLQVCDWPERAGCT